MRRRYTWYLRTPFRSQFDCLRWWEGQSAIEPAAALYELARRHPLVRESWLRNFADATRRRRGVAIWLPSISQRWVDKIIQFRSDNLAAPHSLYWTCLTGLKSWVHLSYTERRNWECSVGLLKGLDFRWGELQCRSIRSLADWKIRCDREDKLGDIVRGKRRGAEIGKIINESLAANPPTAKEWEAAIAYRAIEAYRDGYVLLAVAPDLAEDKLRSLVSQSYKQDLRRYHRNKAKSRARWEDWLPLISEFESAETGTEKAKSQLFARYRRAVDGIQFA